MTEPLADRLDHVAVAVRGLAAACERYRARGFDAQPGGRHPGCGTENAIVPLEGHYLELISIADETEGLGSVIGAPIAALVREATEKWAGFALATSSIERAAEALGAQDDELVGPIRMSRRTPDGQELRWLLLLPRGRAWGAVHPFLIQWDDHPPTRPSRPVSHPNGARAIEEIVIQGDVDRASSFMKCLGLEPQKVAGDAVVTLPDGVRLVLHDDGAPTSSEGISQVVMSIAGGGEGDSPSPSTGPQMLFRPRALATSRGRRR